VVADLLKQFIDNIPLKVRKARKKRIIPEGEVDSALKTESPQSGLSSPKTDEPRPLKDVL
jgi:hypothetical protein